MDVSTGLTLVQTVLQIFDSTIWTEIESVLGVESQLERLKQTMSTINNVLLDAEQQERLHQGCCSNTERGRLERLKEALYQADDLFDEVITLAHRNQLITGNNLCNKVCLFFSTSNQLCSAFSWSREIKEITKMLDDILKDHHHDFGLKHPVSLEGSRGRNNPRETQSYVCEEGDVIIGRDDDKQVITDMLLDTTVADSVCFVSIVGIGGLGKTTLAQLVYNDERIGNAFPLKMWICVSDDFNVEALLRKILAAATNQETNSMQSLDQLQTSLREAFEGKKYLLVLDDIWNEDREEWRKLRNVLIQGGKGSRVLVTTRSREVGKVVGSQKVHELKGLSEEDSWNLFERMALEPGRHQMEAHLVDIGKEILRKCANVPLAIRVIGSLLRGQGESRWRIINNTDLAKVKQDGTNGIVPVLKISYYYLPLHLKSCFSYCSIYPKDYKILKEDLISFWMAQGFIMPSDGQSFEDAGEEYFTELLQRCFFQDVERDEITGEILFCKMHDLIHDLAEEVAGIETFNESCFNEKTRHVFLHDDSLQMENLGQYLTKMKRLRTILQYIDYPILSKKLLLKVRYLRVLDLSHTNLIKVPSMIGELLHLRYLDLSGNYDSLLPKSITQLYNLQTLNLRSCLSLKEWPRDLSNCWSLTHMPQGLAYMTNLHKLTRFVFDSSAAVRDLKYLNNLRGSMKFKVQRGCTYDATEVKEGRYLINKPHLSKIKIHWFESGEDSEEGNNSEALLQGLQPHPNVRKLKLRDYPGVQFPRWGGSSMNLETCLPNLVKIELHGCRRLEHFPSMSQLRQLKYLRLGSFKELEYLESSNISGEGNHTASRRSRQVGVDDEMVFFPSLEKLALYSLPKLKGWWKLSSRSGLESGEGETDTSNENHIIDKKNEQQQQQQFSSVGKHSYSFPRLADLEIMYCPALATFPLCPTVKHLDLNNSNELMLEIEEVKPSSSPRSGCKEGEGESREDNHDGHDIQDDTPCRCITPSLRELGLTNLPKLVKLPKGMHHLAALRSLFISCCENLEMLPPWIACLSSLEILSIKECKKLKSLPDEMCHLTSLQGLYLRRNSEELHQRCRKPTGVDWPKIQHIPHITNEE